MKKSNNKLDSHQLNILEYIQRMQSAQGNESGHNIDAALRRSLSAALKQCRLSAFQVAGEMSHILGETITEDMIYSWTAESKPGHQIWAIRLSAFCAATGDRRPLGVLAEAAGAHVFAGPDALRAEIQRYDEEEKRARAEKRKRLAFLEYLEADRKNTGR